MISQGKDFTRSIARWVLPDAVGPINKIAGGLVDATFEKL